MHVCQKETVWNEAGWRIVSLRQLQSRRGKNNKRHVNYVEDRKPVVHIFEYWTWAQAQPSGISRKHRSDCACKAPKTALPVSVCISHVDHV